MVSFLALYRGESLQSAELVAVSTNRELVAHVAEELLTGRAAQRKPDDPALDSIREGKNQALRLVRDEAQEGVSDG